MNVTMDKKKVYVGCSLNQAPADFRQMVSDFKDQLRAEGYEVLEFVGVTGGTPKDVYETDINCVRSCQAFIAVCDLPSLGLGQEIQEAIHLGTPTLVVGHVDANVSRMVIGAAEIESTVTFVRYENLADVIPLVAELFTPVT
ncbi:MAG TPA: hypothetical protein VGE30_03970 [Candidatus Saccharimonadales bacterium]